MTNLTVIEAQTILNEFTCLEIQSVDLLPDKTKVRQALEVVTRLSEYQMLGICANSAAEGLSALESYLTALGYKKTVESETLPAIDGPIYIKFNGLKQTYHIDGYNGPYRGVLVSCQSSAPDGVNGTYGHLPLDLFV